MTQYKVNVEVSEDGKAMAHVMHLPGCMVRAHNREAALAVLPTAIRDYYAWLDRHGEPHRLPDSITLEVVEVVEHTGPFDPGNRAALFATDTLPLTREEMVSHIRFAAHNRADLLALTAHLPDQMLDWQPDLDSMSIRQVLRHVGNAEEWYVSRLVEPETLPVEWESDEDLPVFTFLEMSRRTAVDRLRRLTDQELTRTHIPTAWTRRPGEPWTARKALRRLLEHEREHIGHIRELLAQWRLQLLAHLAAERTELLYLLLALNEEWLTSRPVFADYSAAELLAHIGAWDAVHTERIRLALAGRESEAPTHALDDYNERLHEAHRTWTVDQAVNTCTVARQEFLTAFSQASDEAVHRTVLLPGGEKTSIRSWALWRIRHDAAHAIEIADWRRKAGPAPAPGPLPLLLAALQAGRDEISALCELVRPEERVGRTVDAEDAWTLRDIIGHIADWELYALEVLRAGRLLDMGYDGDVQRWNEAHRAMRLGQSWSEVQADFQQIREDFVKVVSVFSTDDLAQTLPNLWGRDPNRYRWIASFIKHEREHAIWLRAALMPHLPARLVQDGS